MTAIDRLNEILKQLKQLEDDTTYSPYQPKSAASMMNALATFSENLPDITQQLETAIIEIEDELKDPNVLEIEDSWFKSIKTTE
jgi:hypothetical protein